MLEIVKITEKIVKNYVWFWFVAVYFNAITLFDLIVIFQNNKDY